MSAAIAAVAGATVVGAVISSSATESAAQTQANAATSAASAQLQATNNTNALNYMTYLQGMQNESPYMQAGQEALSALLSGEGFGAGALQVGGSQGGPDLIAPAGSAAANSAVSGTAGGQITPSTPGYVASGAPTAGGYNVIQYTAANPGPNGQTSGYGPATTALPGIGQITTQNYGASQQQLNNAAAAIKPGSLSTTFTNADLNANLAPSYQFMLNQGLQSLQASDIANGTLMSGQGGKDITNYAENYASTGYQQAYNNFMNSQQQQFNQLSTLAGLGTTGTNAATAAGTQAGANIASNTQAGVSNANAYTMGAASASAAGSIANANTLSKGVGSLGSIASNYFTNNPVSTSSLFGNGTSFSGGATPATSDEFALTGGVTGG